MIIFGVDKESQLILKCRFPVEVNKFQPLVVRNNQIEARMLAVSSKCGMSPIELFIGHAPSYPHLNNENDHFIQLSTDGIDIDEENDEDKEDD